MEYAYSIVMFCLSGGMLLYALFISFRKYDMIPKSHATNPPDKKAYAKQFAKLVALVAIAPAASGVVGLFGKEAELPAIIVLFAGIVALMVIGVRWVKKVM